MVNKIGIKNFKCFNDIEVTLNTATLLLGVNSGGKSTVLQSLVISDMCLNEKLQTGYLDLENNKYVNLHSFNEIINHDSYDDFIQISLSNELDAVTTVFKETDDLNTVEFEVNSNNELYSNMIYLNSERILANLQKRGNSKQIELGSNNEYLAYIIDKAQKGSMPIYVERNSSYARQSRILSMQINEWLNYILPGNYVSSKGSTDENYLSLLFGDKSNLHKGNIGYGVSYVLPIIIGGLIADKGAIFVIENPELHLHPAAQSNIAYFLAHISACGVQVVVETHSEHIVNGFRKAALDTDNLLKSSDVDIHFFGDSSKSEIETIRLDKKAEIDHWPKGFMDQMESDLFYMRKARRGNV